MSGAISSSTPSFGILLRRYREGAGLSQAELAERAGVSWRTISDLERGVKQAPRRSTLRLLAEALAVSTEERAALQASAYPPDVEPEPRPPVTVPTNLPLALTSFVGREREIAMVRHLLGQMRLVTLTGAGGCGKTRLALEVARRLAEQPTPSVADGKPEPYIFESARSLLPDCRRVAIVGDHLESDVAGGKRAGLTTILVLTGTTSRAELEAAEVEPDVVLDDLAALLRL